MSAKHDVGTPSGLIAFFERRAEKLERDAQRRAAKGTGHPLHQVYAMHARDDLSRVRGLIASLTERRQ